MLQVGRFRRTTTIVHCGDTRFHQSIQADISNRIIRYSVFPHDGPKCRVTDEVRGHGFIFEPMIPYRGISRTSDYSWKKGLYIVRQSLFV